jgi:hypothetical protein
MLVGYKTYIVAALTILAGFWLFASGQVDSSVFLQLLSTALIGAGLRAGIAGK